MAEGADEGPVSAEVREAVAELQQYLSDRLAPLMVVDSLALLVHQPPLLAAEVAAWAAYQRTSAADLSLADLLYHGARKIAMMGELDLVPKADIAQCLDGVTAALLPRCPEEQRELLKQNLERLRHATLGGVTSADIPVLERQPGSPPVQTGQDPAATLSPEATLGLRRLSLFLERLQPLVAGTPAPAAPPEQRGEVASQFMTAAAVQASTSKELEQHLAPLREFGVDTRMDQVLRTLARSLPGWGSLPSGSGTAAPLVGLQLNAMRQIVSLAEAPEEAATRFRELVHAAIEQFNEGNLGRAVTMFELADQLAVEQKVKPAFVEPLRKGGHEYLDPERLRRSAEGPGARPQLKKILDFFLMLRPEGLLRELDGEPRRERRRQLLALLEVHGEEARASAWELLKASVESPEANPDPFFQMNLIYLLRVIPRPATGSVEDEVDVVLRVGGRDSPTPLVKQVIAYFSALRHDKSERSLITYLRVFENMVLQPETAVYSPTDLATLLDRTCIALARYGTPRSWHALVDHGLKAEPRLGSPMARLVEAGRQDLSGAVELVERLIEALRAELPRSVLGFTVRKNDDRILWLVRALSGTPLPEVRDLFEEIVERYGDQAFAEAAAKALDAMDAGPAAAETSGAGLAGDLELFGLPGVLQTLSQSQLTGVLSLMSSQGKIEGSILLEDGRFRGAQFGTLRGEEAAYQLFERPFPGTFAFVKRPDLSGQGTTSSPQEVVNLLLEGVRRHDEFKRSAALVPDQVVLDATGAPSTTPPDEKEEFAQVVWSTVANGATAVECETTVKADGYRVRRLLAHWVEQGALKIRASSA